MSATALPGPGPSPSVAEAFAACEAITRREAKNFAVGIRLLHRSERQALSAVYALARRIDDIGDGDEPVADRLAGLDRVEADLAALRAGGSGGGDPVLVAVAAAARTYPLPLEAFGELVAGCRRDVVGTRYEDLDGLVGYCRLVAGTIGRLTVGVLGVTDADSVRRADDLGVALQLTNIIRDVAEDRAMGRVYVPAGEARAVGASPELDDPPEVVGRVVARLGREADAWYDRGLTLLPRLEGRGRACVAALAGIYRRLLGRILDDPAAVCSGRVSLSAPEKAAVALRSLAGLAVGPASDGRRR